jgi:hypothetical protein
VFFSRGKNHIQSPYVFEDMYKEYIKDIAEDSPYYVTFKEYTAINNLFWKEISHNIIDEGRTFHMPFMMGDTYVEKVKLDYNNRLPINWQLTTQLGKVIYNLNEHSQGYRYELKWNKHVCTFTNNYLFKLVYTRSNKRLLAKNIKSKKNDYFESSKSR